MNALQRLRLFADTVRYLKPIQIYGRFGFALARPKPDMRPAPSQRKAEPSAWVRPAARRQSQLDRQTFRFLNETHTVAGGWDDSATEKLWRYNLHYFDDLNAAGAAERREWHADLMRRWIEENPPGNVTGWEAYPTSLRIVNWIKWSIAGNQLTPVALDSLAIQARWLTRRLEYHLLGNHLIANAKALVFAGSYFEGPEADEWQSVGLEILEREVPEQILEDGGHFELSTMYHALALEDVLDLLNLTRAFPMAPASARVAAVLSERAGPMLHWLDCMCHPDGEISFFNDAAIGIAPSPTELTAYAKRLGIPASRERTEFLHLDKSGYLRLTSENAVTLLDVARVGPDYIPGHAHADTLSFEMSLGEQRVLVNSGTSVYGTGPERLRQRGTAAHNTVTIDGENSSEVWSGFRVARRARPFGLSIDRQDSVAVTCSHDGYRRLHGRPIHRRSWRLLSSSLIVSDEIVGSYRSAEAHFHFHPALLVESNAGSTGVVTLPDGQRIRWAVEIGGGSLQHTTYHPEFGTQQPNCRLAVALNGGRSTVRFDWGEGG